MGYDVLVRIAQGLGIPRAVMGLAGIEVEAESEEVDEDVERRKLLAIAGAIMFGAPLFGDPEPLTGLGRRLPRRPRLVTDLSHVRR